MQASPGFWVMGGEGFLGLLLGIVGFCLGLILWGLWLVVTGQTEVFGDDFCAPSEPDTPPGAERTAARR